VRLTYMKDKELNTLCKDLLQLLTVLIVQLLILQVIEILIIEQINMLETHQYILMEEWQLNHQFLVMLLGDKLDILLQAQLT